MNKVHRQIIPKKPKCEGVTATFICVGLPEIRPALAVLIIGTWLSLIIMGLEILHKKFDVERQFDKAVDSYDY